MPRPRSFFNFAALPTWILALVPVLLWGSSFVVTKAIYADWPPITVAAGRWLIATLFFLGWVLARGQIGSVTQALRAHPGTIFAFGLVGVGVLYVAQNLALTYTTVTNVSVLGNLFPVFVLLLSILVLGERVSRTLAVAVLGATVGATLVSVAGGAVIVAPEHFVGDGLAILAAVAGAVYIVLGKRIVNGFSPAMVTLLAAGNGVPLSGSPGPDHRWRSPRAQHGGRGRTVDPGAGQQRRGQPGLVDGGRAHGSQPGRPLPPLGAPDRWPLRRALSGRAGFVANAGGRQHDPGRPLPGPNYPSRSNLIELIQGRGNPLDFETASVQGGGILQQIGTQPALVQNPRYRADVRNDPSISICHLLVSLRNNSHPTAVPNAARRPAQRFRRPDCLLRRHPCVHPLFSKMPSWSAG